MGCTKQLATMSSEQKPARHRPSHLIFGLILLIVGGVLLLDNLGWSVAFQFWRYYPVLLLTLGVWGLIHPSRHLDRSGAVWLLAAGIYCLIGTYHLLGLGWGSAWPIFVIAAGLSVLLHRHDSMCATTRTTHSG